MVSKRISARFFHPANNKILNPPSGTVVDDVVTLPERYDFYLISQVIHYNKIFPKNVNVTFEWHCNEYTASKYWISERTSRYCQPNIIQRNSWRMHVATGQAPIIDIQGELLFISMSFIAYWIIFHILHWYISIYYINSLDVPFVSKLAWDRPSPGSVSICTQVGLPRWRNSSTSSPQSIERNASLSVRRWKVVMELFC